MLKREHPEIAEQIREKIKKTLPEERLYDTGKIREIVDSYRKIKGEQNIWQRGLRDELIAVVLLFYQPERLLGLSDRKINSSIVSELSEATGGSYKMISHHSRMNVIGAFKIYAEFRKGVYETYRQIIEDLKLFR